MECRWRSDYRHTTDTVIPSFDGYAKGVQVVVTNSAEEVVAEFQVDPDESSNITAAQNRCGKQGTIAGRSDWGWLKVNFEDGTQSHWFTPFCLWILRWRTVYRHKIDTVIP